MRAATSLFLSACSVITFALPTFAETIASSANCPYSCKTEGLPKPDCRDYRIGDRCYIEYSKPARDARAQRVCVSRSGQLYVRTSCLSSETKLDIASLKGAKGDKGEQGEQGIQGAAGVAGNTGPQGTSGSLRVYGDGSAGDRTIATNTTLNDSNPQYENFTVAPGVLLTVYPGTVIRCTDTFTNLGTIVVMTANPNSPKFAENGTAPSGDPSPSQTALGGIGGAAIDEGVARGLLRPLLFTAGDGIAANGSQRGGFGGGTLSILCKEGVINEVGAEIIAEGQDAPLPASGGGGGGLIVLASAAEVENLGTISVIGGTGGTYIPDVSGTATGYASGGGGGGGIIHLVAPTITNTGTTSINGGAGGPAGGPGSLTANFKSGGGSGGGSGGSGGDGATANPGNANNGSATVGETGASGKLFETLADPAAFF